MLDQVGSAIAILGGVIVVGGGLLGLLAFAIMRKLDERKDTQTARILELTEKERDLYKGLAEQLPQMRTELAVLKDQVSGAKAVGELRRDVEGGFARIIESLASHERRAARSDAWQAAFNKGIVDGLNQLLAAQHREAVTVTPPPEAQ